MKNFKYYFSLLIIPLILSCNTDDDNNSEPEPEPVVANAKIVNHGDCRFEELIVRLYDPDPNIIPQEGMNYDEFQFFNIPEEYRILDLEIYIEYQLPENSIFCPDFGFQSFVLEMTEIQVATESPEE